MKYELTKNAQSIVDFKNGTYKAFAAEATPEGMNEAFRAVFNEILPKPNAAGRYNRRELLKAIPECFAILDEVLDVTVKDAWSGGDAFYREFVDYRNVALGDKPQFIIEALNWIAVNEFSGNYWKTDRQKLTGKRAITVETKWFVTHVYDDFERFLVGAITIEQLINAMTTAWVRHGDTLVATVFNDAASSMPADFNIANTLTTAEMKELIQKVKVKAGVPAIRIMGTEAAIAQLNDLAEVKYSDAMMNEVYSTGRLGKWMGNTIVEIPQAFEVGTTDFIVADNVLLIVPEGEKFIKFVDEGETRSRELTEKDNDDQTLSWEVQRKLGCAAVFGSAFGKFTII